MAQGIILHQLRNKMLFAASWDTFQEIMRNLRFYRSLDRVTRWI